MAGADWIFRAVTPDCWDDMAALFEGRGGPKNCWCMVWRLGLDGAQAPAPAPERRAAMQRLVMAGQSVGILAYDQGEPVAWASLAPRPAFGAGLGTDGPLPGRWSLTCFFIRADHRRQNGFSALLAAAEARAAAEGAQVLDAYPVDPESPSYRFSGFVPSFEAEGFVAVGKVGSRRHIFRKVLPP